VRKVPIPPELVELLHTYIDQLGVAPDGRLFRSENGNPLQPSTWWQVWQKVRAAYGPQNPSDDGIRRRDVSGTVKRAVSKTAGRSPVGADSDGRPQQDSNLRSRLWRRQTKSFEFAHLACLDSIIHPFSGRDHSAHIPDHGNFRRDGPHLAGDGPRPVRAGSGLALIF
jgi:hypothetical protein